MQLYSREWVEVAARSFDLGQQALLETPCCNMAGDLVVGEIRELRE